MFLSTAKFFWHQLPLPVRGSTYKWFHLRVLAFHRFIDSLFDQKYGVRTSEVFVYDGHLSDMEKLNAVDPCDYIPSAYLSLFRIRREYGSMQGEVIYDLGSGLGRSLFVFSKANAKRVIGVEFNNVLCQGLSKNIETFKGPRENCAALNEDASKINIDDASIIYMYNPFGLETMKLLSESIAKSLISRPRRLSIIYWHPLHVDALMNLQNFKVLKKFVTKRKPVLFINVGSD